MQTIEQELRHFVVENFLFGQDNNRLSDDDSLLEQGIIDSTGVMELIGFLESRYRISIHDRELRPENLDSIHRLTAFITRKLQDASAGVRHAG